MAGNFIAMVYAVLKDKNVDTSKMTPEQAVEKYNELVGKSGKYNVETGEKEIEENSKKVLTKDSLHSNIHSFPKPKDFGSDKNKIAHKKHIKEMGYKDFEGYEAAAKRFLLSVEGERYMGKVKGRNRYYKFNAETGEFAAVGEDGYIITYFKAKKGSLELAKKYFQEDMKKKGSIKL